jgi:tRNA G18 (ribose-2'-O)-methylase SpoU
MEQITLVLDNIRSAHNVGAIMRSAAAFGIQDMACLGVTPYPRQGDDSRLPHIASRAHRAIAKTALGAEEALTVRHFQHIDDFRERFTASVYALEQTPEATGLPEFRPRPPLALIIGNELEGVSGQALARTAGCIQIPQETTAKASLNVATACGVALYDCYAKLHQRTQDH